MCFDVVQPRFSEQFEDHPKGRVLSMKHRHTDTLIKPAVLASELARARREASLPEGAKLDNIATLL